MTLAWSSLNSKQKRYIFFIIGAVVMLPALLLAAKNRQDIRNYAAGSGEAGVEFAPAGGNVTHNQVLTLTVNMYKIASRAISVSGAQAVFTVDSRFTIGSATCVAPFDGLPFVKVSGQSVTVMCAIASGGSPVALTSANKPFANIKLTVGASAPLGAANVTFTSTRVTEAGIAGQAPDVSTGGETASFNVTTLSPTPSQTPTPTRRMTPTPTPSDTPAPIPSGSPTPTPSATPTPTISAQQACIDTGFTWKSFPDSCVDSCDLLASNRPSCLQEFTYGCDCLANRCWNGSRCVLNATGLTPSPTPSPTRIPTNTPTPPSSPTPTRTPTPTPEVFPTEIVPTEPGLLTCRGNPARLTCFESWRIAFTSGTVDDEADMTEDGNVSLSDFELWRRAYTGNNPTAAPTSTL